MISEERKIVVAKGQFGVVINCVDKHLKPQLGKRELRKGYCTFFLHPGKFVINKNFYTLFYEVITGYCSNLFIVLLKSYCQGMTKLDYDHF